MIGYVGADGEYHTDKDGRAVHPVNMTWKKWDHERQRKEFAKDIIQPRKNGKPNPAFIKAWPEQAKDYFTSEEIKRAEREL